MDLARALADLGLHETEAKFYVAALELGGASMRDVAEKAGISRTNAYDVFERLRGQGLVSEESGNGARLSVIAAPPSDLLSIFEERSRKLQHLMPDLNSLHVSSQSKPRVRYYQGVAGIKEVLEGTLTCRSKKLLAILSMRDLYQVPGREWMDDLVARRIALGIHLRAIRSPANDLHKRWSDNKKELRQLRYAPEGFLFHMTVYVCDEKVAIISSQRENFGMTIDSPEYAAMQAHLFEALWSICAAPAAEPAAGGTARMRAGMR